MSKRFNIKITVLSVLSVSLIVSSVITCILTFYYHHKCFQILSGFCEKVIQIEPHAKQAVFEVLKTQDFYAADRNGYVDSILPSFGYQPSHLKMDPTVLWIACLGFLAGCVLFIFAFWYFHKKSIVRIKTLTDYLEKINTGSQGLLLDNSEDEFSRLQDEIYKTVTTLYQTRDAALIARNNFADNLSNIAHQLKTPLTSISLSIQMAKKHLGNDCTAKIERQIHRLMHLGDNLLLLSRIEAGTLRLNRTRTDVFTLLTMAADNLYELFVQKGVFIHIPEMGEIDIYVDIDWTMEAVMNLLKNCMEAAETGTTVHCSYETNPLYVQIRVWDEGQGFAKEDLPHLFERFYRGKNTKDSGIGIGLSLAKAIIEMQNGIIRACNLPGGGACFEIRFYSEYK